jgi:hypothetical protein
MDKVVIALTRVEIEALIAAIECKTEHAPNTPYSDEYDDLLLTFKDADRVFKGERIKQELLER